MSWVLIIIVVAVIFYAHKLPQLRAKAEQKIHDSKIVDKAVNLYEKSKKELNAKTAVLAEKAKEKKQANETKKATTKKVDEK